MKYLMFMVMFTCVSTALFGQDKEEVNYKNSIGISPINYFLDAAQDNNTYLSDGFRIGVYYNRKLGKRFAVDLPVYLSFSNQFINIYPGVQFFLQGKPKVNDYATIAFAYENGKAVVCTGRYGGGTKIIPRQRVGVMLGWGIQPRLTENLSFKFQLGTVVYLTDNVYNYSSEYCTPYFTSLYQAIGNFYALMGISYSF